MVRLEVSGAVRQLYGSLGAEGLITFRQWRRAGRVGVGRLNSTPRWTDRLCLKGANALSKHVCN